MCLWGPPIEWRYGVRQKVLSAMMALYCIVLLTCCTTYEFAKRDLCHESGCSGACCVFGGTISGMR